MKKDSWYVNAAPRSAHRSKDAYIRERLRERTKEVDQKIEDALWGSHIELGQFSTEKIGDDCERTMGTLSAGAGDYIVETLIEEWSKEGGLGRTKRDEHRIGRPYQAWGPHARTHARRWLEAKAPISHWAAIVSAAHDAHNQSENESVSMKRLVDLVGKGPEFAKKIGSCDPWVAREACSKMPNEVLDEETTKWAIRAVQMYAKTIWSDHEVTDQDAERALEHWRWPTIRPPLAVVAACAGKMPALRTDNAWANTLTQVWLPLEQWSSRWPEIRLTWEETERSILQRRENEEGTANEAMNKVAENARMGVQATSAGETSTIIERCRKEWRNSEKLEGDGTIGQPRLEAVNHGRTQQMRWVFDIHGPEVLLAGCAFAKMRIEDALENYDMNRLALALSIEKTVDYGKLFEREPGTRETQNADAQTLTKKKWQR